MRRLLAHNLINARYKKKCFLPVFPIRFLPTQKHCADTVSFLGQRSIKNQSPRCLFSKGPGSSNTKHGWTPTRALRSTACTLPAFSPIAAAAWSPRPRSQHEPLCTAHWVFLHLNSKTPNRQGINIIGLQICAVHEASRKSVSSCMAPGSTQHLIPSRS